MEEHERRLARVVSIHAPARGATIFSPVASDVIVFLSTPPREGRPSRLSAQSSRLSFYPRPRERGDRRWRRSMSFPTTRFYPRPRERGDCCARGR